MARRRGRNPGSVTSIGNNAFAFCNNLTGIVIPAGVTDIAEGTFYFCSSLSDVTIPGSVSSIGDRAFDNCSTLTGIIISQAVTRIGNYAFGNCSSLRGITVAAANPAYSSEAGILFDKAKTALLQCPGGRPGTYAVPEGVTTIGPSAFASCRDRTGITLPDSLHGIGPGAFGSCSRLSEITIPPKVSSIELQAFAFCASLMDITVHPANRSYSSAGGVLFQEDEGTAELQCFPGGKAGHYRIPHGVTSILPHAFLECPNLTGLTIPASLSGIRDDAFGACGKLRGIYFEGDAPHSGESREFPHVSATIYFMPGTMNWEETYRGRPTVLWNPQVQTGDPSSGMKTDGAGNRIFGFTIDGPPGVMVLVKASSGLAPGGSTEPARLTLDETGSGHFSDPGATRHSARFYRLSMP